jgi:2-polyprenyl-3-methyl-5-hydroxy-6-metoxy-1,4-benzoquinol methylase
MSEETDYLKVNQLSWNNRVDTHIDSAFYDLPNFLKGETSLNSIELGLLGNVEGKSILHLQCHFGQDTISLSRLGAEVTGVDLSDKAIERAKEIAIKTKSSATFICCDVYDLSNHLDQQFDIVFTSYGTIGWLPDMQKWAEIVSHFLKPAGHFVFAEFHPVVWMFDDHFEQIGYNYFNKVAIVETETGTYADKNAAISQEYIMWNHSLSEVMSSLLDNQLEIVSFQEYDYSPYNCFKNTVEFEPKKYRIAHLGDKIPMVYSIVARKE